MKDIYSCRRCLQKATPCRDIPSNEVDTCLELDIWNCQLCGTYFVIVEDLEKRQVRIDLADNLYQPRKPKSINLE